MQQLNLRVRRAVPALVLAAAAMLVTASAATARTALVELRVEGPNVTLDPGTWYVTGPERARKSRPADSCRRTRGTLPVGGPSPLSLVQSASESRRSLRQVRVRRDGAGLFLCEIGSLRGRSFAHPAGFAGWTYYEGFTFPTQGADQLRLQDGDSVLWVYSDFGAQQKNTCEALELRGVPARSDGQFTVRLVEHGFQCEAQPNPAMGATIHGAESVLPLPDDRYRVSVRPGWTRLWASNGLAVPSNRVLTCFRGNPGRCPAAHGRTIVGSARDERLPGTRGWDRIGAGGGRDVVDLRRGGRDRAACGGGRDVVLLARGDRDDRIARSCERVRRS